MSARCEWSPKRWPTGIIRANSLRFARSRRSWGFVLRQSVRRWVRQSEVDHGQRPGKTTQELAEIRELKRENAELRRANEILKSASAFFAAELDRPHRF